MLFRTAFLLRSNTSVLTWALAYSVMVVVIVALALFAWFVSIKHVFRGPSINMEMLLKARNETLKGSHVIDGRVLGPEKDEVVVKKD